jgi:glycosyltransferase 2 family protein
LQDSVKKSLKVLLTLSIIILLSINVDLDDFLERLTDLNLYQILGALFFLILQSFVVSKRWQAVLAKISYTVPYTKILRTHYLSLSSSIILPNLIAEPAIKAFFLKRLNVPVSGTIRSVVIDKLLMLFGLLGLTLLVAPLVIFFYPATLPWAYLYMLIVFLLVFLRLIMHTGILNAIKNIELEFFKKYYKYLDKAKLLFTDDQLIIQALLLSFLSQFFAICSVYILSLSMDPGLSMIDCMLLMPPVMLATAIPVAFNGWGIRELAMIYVLGFASISSESAFALSVQFGTIGLLMWSIGLLMWIPVKIGDNESVQ